MKFYHQLFYLPLSNEMKKLMTLFLVMIIFGCDDSFENTYRYSKIITQSKTYPVYIDASEINKNEVKSDVLIIDPFKILANDKYYFIGDMLYGIHVYEKLGNGVKLISFIECLFLKDFEISGNHLYCNNLVDLLVIDVSDPGMPTVLERRERHFNRYTSFKEYWNLPYENEKGFIVGSETYELTGMVTNEQPDLDFSAYDDLYKHITTKEIPDNWFSEHPEYDKPYIGMVKMETDLIYTYGSYNSWAICNYHSGYLSVKEHDLWTTPRINFSTPYYYSNAFPIRMFFEDNIIFNIGVENNLMRGYIDCIFYHENFPIRRHLYFQFEPLDICYVSEFKAFYVLSGTSIWGVFLGGDEVSGITRTYVDFEISTDAVEIARVGEQLITVGNELSVYSVTQNELFKEKIYPEIAGECFMLEGNNLVVYNNQEILLYDISDLENIQLIQ